MAQGAGNPRRRYWLVTSPRTASNMLVKILNLDAQGVRPANNGGYFFMPTIVGRCKAHIEPVNTWKEDQLKHLTEAQDECFETFKKHIAAAEEEGQLLFVKEHAIMMTDPVVEAEYVNGGPLNESLMKGVERPQRSPLNLTSMPDEFLKTWHPTFLIRHPAMMFPSLYRTCKDVEVDGFQRPNQEPMAFERTIKWIRTLYDFYADYFSEDDQWPIVLDADDIMKHPELVVKYAQIAGLDPNKLRFSWEKATEEKLKETPKVYQRMLSSINASSKIDTSKIAGDVNIDEEAVKWRNEFGEERGRRIEQWVRDALPDYQFLHSKRLVV